MISCKNINQWIGYTIQRSNTDYSKKSSVKHNVGVLVSIIYITHILHAVGTEVNHLNLLIIYNE